MGHSGRALSRRTIEAMVSMADDGVPTGEIAAIFGCSPGTVVHYLPEEIKRRERNLSYPIIGHGAREFKRERADLFRRARLRDRAALERLAQLGLTGYWVHGEGTHLARRGFDAVACVVP